MTSIFEKYVQLNESFQNKYIRMFAQDALLYKNSWKGFTHDTRMHNIAWDKVTNDDIIEFDIDDYNPASVDDVAKMFRALRAGKGDYYSPIAKQRIDFKSRHCIIFGYGFNDKLKATYNSFDDSFFEIDRGRLVQLTKPREMESALLDGCSKIYVVLADTLSTAKLSGERRGSRIDMIPSLDAEDRKVERHQGVLGKDPGGVNPWGGGQFTMYCKSLVREAKDRWKEIIANNRFKKTADTKEIDDLAKSTMDIYFQFIQDCTKAAATNKKIEQYSLGRITKLVLGEVQSSKHSESGWLNGGLINIYGKYCEANISLASGKSYDPDTALKTRNSYAEAIKSLSRQIKEKTEQYRKDWSI